MGKGQGPARRAGEAKDGVLMFSFFRLLNTSSRPSCVLSELSRLLSPHTSQEADVLLGCTFTSLSGSTHIPLPSLRKGR